MCQQVNETEHSCCRGGRLKGFAQPRLLLQLSQKPAHGYELMDIFSQGDDLNIDPGNLYRLLRSMEDDGLVISSWDTSGGGAARRVYQITDQGLEHLHAWIITIRRTRQLLDELLASYEIHFSQERNVTDVPSL
jgi:PadR family transcriptional regulator, regulatory protein PadR